MDYLFMQSIAYVPVYCLQERTDIQSRIMLTVSTYLDLSTNNK
jgi:hypothetical protein